MFQAQRKLGISREKAANWNCEGDFQSRSRTAPLLFFTNELEPISKLPEQDQ
jgi:hypothetical protein